MVQPEGHPGHTDDHEGGDVDGDNVVRDLPLELHVYWEAAVHPSRCLNVALENWRKINFNWLRRQRVQSKGLADESDQLKLDVLYLWKRKYDFLTWIYFESGPSLTISLPAQIGMFLNIQGVPQKGRIKILGPESVLKNIFEIISFLFEQF